MGRALAAFVGAVSLVALPSAQRDTPPSIPELLDLYQAGDFATAGKAGVALPSLASLGKNYPIAARAWIDLGPDQRARRRLVAAGLVVEVARERYERDATSWTTLRGMVEWSCNELRRDRTPSEGEHAWQRVSVALAQRVREPSFLGGIPRDRSLAEIQANDRKQIACNHIILAQARFPSDPHFALARAIGADQADTDITWRAARKARMVAKAVPGQSATLALASSRTATDAPDDIWKVVEGTFATPGRNDDPARLYAYGDYMHWSALVARLHEALR